MRTIAKKPGEFMFTGRSGSGRSITTRQYARLVSEFGHTKVESTVRYLGIKVDDALAIAEQVDV
jgi:ABC-type microcin C transport system duplicated ATPase subunit YejF